MATAAQVLKSILQKIIVSAPESDLEASEFQDTIFSMNNFMTDLASQGVNLGYTIVTDLGDEITIPLGALRGLIYNVALEMAPEFDRVPTPGLVRIANSSLATMRMLGVHIGESRFPGTLPIGSGNETFGFGHVDKFFPDAEAQILAETSGAIGLEADTVPAT